jgi:Tfp pilus assembly protein PilF
MKKSLLWSLLVVVIGVWVAEVRAADPSDPSDQFLEAYFRIQEGDTAERQGNWALAQERFKAALGLLNTIRTQSPNWNPHIIEFRIGYCNEHLAAIKPHVAPAPVAAPAPAPVEVPPSIVVPPAVEAPPATVVVPPPKIEVPPVAAPPAVVVPDERLARLEADLASARDQIKVLEGQRTKLQADLQRELAKTPTDTASPQVEKLLQQNKELAGQVAKLQTEMASMREAVPPPVIPQVENDQVIQLRADLASARAEIEKTRQELDRERTALASVRQELDDTKSELGKVRESYNNVVAVLTDANRKLTAMQAAKGMDEQIILQLRKENALLRVIADSKAVATSTEAKEYGGPHVPELKGWRPRNWREPQHEAKPATAVSVTEKSQREKLVASMKAPPVETEKVPGPVAAPSSAPATSPSPASEASPVAAATPEPKAPPSTPAAKTVPPPPDIEIPKPMEPADIPTLLEAAKSAFATNNLETASANWEMVLASDATNAVALAGLATTRYQQRNIDAAESLGARWLKQEPNSSKAYALVGIIHLRKGHSDEAFDALTRATAIDPDNAEAHNYLGICLSERGQIPAAERSIQKALAINSQYADAHFNLAVLYVKSKPPKYELARWHYQAALRAGGKNDARMEAILSRAVDQR